MGEATHGVGVRSEKKPVGEPLTMNNEKGYHHYSVQPGLFDGDHLEKEEDFEIQVGYRRYRPF